MTQIVSDNWSDFSSKVAAARAEGKVISIQITPECSNKYVADVGDKISKGSE